MRNRFYITLLLLSLFSCGPSKVVYDYDEAVSFNGYKTYNIYPNLDSGLSQLDEKRVLQVIDEVLQAKAFVKSDTPDFYVNVIAKEYVSQNNSSIGVGIGTGGRGGGIGVSGGIPIPKTNVNQVLIIDIIDVKKDALIWKAEKDSKLSRNADPLQKEAYFQKVITQIFSNFPPQKK